VKHTIILHLVLIALLLNLGCNVLGKEAFKAADKKDWATVMELVREHPSLAKSKNHYGRTLLHTAAFRGRVELAKLLIANGADVNAGGSSGKTPLHGLYFNACEMAKLLIKNGADVGKKNQDGETPLHIMASLGKKDVVELLIANGADAKAEDKEGRTPLYHPALSLRLPVVEALLRGGATLGHPVLDAAFFGDEKEVTEILGKDRALVGVRDFRGNLTPLQWAAARGNLNVVKILVENGASVNPEVKDSARPLMLAVSKGRRDVVEFLIEKGADVRKYLLVFFAVKAGHKGIAEILIAAGADVNLGINGWTPLHEAVWQGNREFAEMLIANGADLNPRVSEFVIPRSSWDRAGAGATPLHCAARLGHRELAELLIEKGADINAKDNWGWTPLHTAASWGNREIAELLIAKGADINAKDTSGHTPLNLAKNDEVKELLRKHETEK